MIEPKTSERRGPAAVACSVLLCLLIVNSLPHAAHFLSSRRPAGRQVCNLSKGRVHLKCFAHGNDSAVFRHVCRATHEPPRMVVRIMRHTENRKPPLDHMPCRDSRDVWRLVKWPVRTRPNDPSSATAAGNARSAATIADKLSEPSGCPAGRRFAAAHG